MPPLRSRFTVLLSALCLFALWNLGVRGAWAQSFVKVVNPANAIVTMGGAPPGSFVGTSWIDSDGDGDADLFTCEVGLFRNDGGGVATYIDTDVEQGQSYGYRLALDEHVRTAETWVAIPSHVSLGIRAVTPNPSPGRFFVTFDLPAPDLAAFEVLDVSGRRIERRELGSLPAGRHVLALGGSRLAPGVYLVRLTQAGRRVTSRVTVLN